MEELKTHFQGRQIVLRSKVPELVKQEFWSLLMAHHKIRGMLQDLALCVRCGYALDDEENEIGVRCIGSPILNDGGYAQAAISIAGTKSQITPENVNHLSRTLIETATNIC